VSFEAGDYRRTATSRPAASGNVKGATTTTNRGRAGNEIFVRSGVCEPKLLRAAETQDVVMDDSDRLSVLRDALRRRLGADRFELWLGDRTRLELSGHTLRVVCASRAELHWLRRKLHHVLAECCVALWSPPPTIAYLELEANAPAPKRASASRSVGAIRGVAPHPPAASPAPNAQSSSSSASLAAVARRTFDNFTIGPGNQLAAGAALDLASTPGRYTPLLLHGPPGCGKSHLLEAVAHAARTARGRVRAVVITAEQFTAQFLDALNQRTLPSFRHKTRSVDMLLVDDIHFLGNKTATVEELLYVIDSLHQRQGQVVLASAAPVAELRAMSPELASRIGAGLTVALDLPDYATRLGIARHAAIRMRIELDKAVVELIARQVVGSARLISGAINRLVAASIATRQPITRDFAERELADFCRQHAPQVRLPDIQRAVCEEFDIEPASLRSQRRTRAASEPRMLCMWLARRYTRAALSEIGDYFGGRRHSTVVSAQHKMEELLSRGADVTIGDRPCQIEEAVRRIEARLRTG
jgi:chromosomal replication initiator protein